MGETIHIITEYLANEEKVVMANSKMDALEVENSKLRKELITTMDNRNQMKEQIKTLKDDLWASNFRWPTVRFMWLVIKPCRPFSR